MAQPQQLNYTHFVAVQLLHVVNDLVGTVKTWSNKKNDVYYGKADTGVPIQNGQFVNTNEINGDVIRNAIYYLYNKRKTEGIEEFGVEETSIFGDNAPGNVLFLGMKKVNEIYTGHIVTKIESGKMGLYSFEYHPKIMNRLRSPIQNLRLEPQLSKADVDAAAQAKTLKDNTAAATARAVADANAKQTILELLSDITKSSPPSSGVTIMNPMLSNSKVGGKRNTKGNRKTQKKRKTQPKKKPKKKSVRKTSKK
jgi:hypothetical protein